MIVALLVAASCRSGPAAEPPQLMENFSGCDPVSCAIDNLGRACCQPPAPSFFGDAADRIEQIGDSIKSCAARIGYEGELTFATTFDARGVVLAVRPVGLGAVLFPWLFECVARLVRRVRFPSSADGATLTDEWWFTR